MRDEPNGRSETVPARPQVDGFERAGKDGDLAFHDGDPLEYPTHCVGTVIEGQVVFEGSR